MIKEFKIYDGDCTVKYSTSEIIAETVIEKIIQFCEQYNVSSGESLVQSDDPLIEAPHFLADIIDSLLEFNTEWK